MDATEPSAKPEVAEAAKPAEAAPAERARARAYLDLWERHVVHIALYGPGPERPPA